MASIEGLLDELEAVVTALSAGLPPELFGLEDMGARWAYTYRRKGARFRVIVGGPTPAAIRERADKLRKMAGRPLTTSSFKEAKRKPARPTRRAGYSKAVAQAFKDARELENFRAYEELYR